MTAECLTALAWLHTHPAHGQGDKHALELLDDTLAIDPAHGSARFEQATILGRQGHFDEATKCYDLSKQAPYFKTVLNESFSAELHVSHCVPVAREQ